MTADRFAYEPIVIPARHRGPPNSGNGGIVSGRLAGLLRPGPVEVTLRAPIPLERPLDVRRRDEGLDLVDGETLLAESRPAELDLGPPPAITWDEAVAASEVGGSDAQSDYNFCFSCGRGHAPDQGLCVWAAPVPGRDVVAAAFRPHAAHAGPDGLLPDPLLWAAIDCPGAVAVGASEDQMMLTGRMVGEVTGRFHAGERGIVVGWPIGAEGRKRYSGTALVNEAGEIIARARITWIVLKPQREA
jgi:hypothetical protein